MSDSKFNANINKLIHSRQKKFLLESLKSEEEYNNYIKKNTSLYKEFISAIKEGKSVDLNDPKILLFKKEIENLMPLDSKFEKDYENLRKEIKALELAQLGEEALMEKIKIKKEKAELKKKEKEALRAKEELEAARGRATYANQSPEEVLRLEKEEREQLEDKQSPLLEKIRGESLEQVRKRLEGKWSDLFQNNIVDEEAQMRVDIEEVKKIYQQKIDEKLNKISAIEETFKKESYETKEEKEKKEEEKVLEDELEDNWEDEFDEEEEDNMPEYNREAQDRYDYDTRMDEINALQGIAIYVAEKYTWKYCFYILFIYPFTLLTIDNFKKVFNILYLYVGGFFVNYIVKFLELFNFWHRQPDRLWQTIRWRFFYKKLIYSLIFFLLSYIFISETYEMYIHRYYAFYYEWMPDPVNLNAYYEGYRLYKSRIQDWDGVTIREFISIGTWSEDDLFQATNWYFRKVTVHTILEMWLFNAIYLFVVSIFFFLSVFIRVLHTVFYGHYETAKKFWILIFMYIIVNCWFFWDFIASIYHYMPTHILYYLFWLGGWGMNFTLSIRFDDDDVGYELYWYDEYDRDVFFDSIPELKNSRPELLEEMPNPYSLDPRALLLEMILEKKRRVEDTNPGGMAYLMYRYEYYTYDNLKGIWENIVENWKKAEKYLTTELLIDTSVANQETILEYMTRYYEEMENPLTVLKYNPETDSFEEVLNGEEFTAAFIVMPHWKSWLSEKMSTGFQHQYWLNEDIPLFIRWCYRIYFFNYAYTFLRRLVKKHNSGEKKILPYTALYFSFWKNFKTFFGYAPDYEKVKFSIFENGYVYKGVLGEDVGNIVIYDDNVRFNSKLYELFSANYFIDFYTWVTKGWVRRFFNLKYFISTFFGSTRFWISVLLFWQKTSPVRVFCRWFFMDVILHSIYVFILFIKFLPGWWLNKVYFCINFMFQIFFVCYIINIKFLSFLLYFFSMFLFIYRILFKWIRPVGPFYYYNPSLWKRLQVNDFWKPFYLFFSKSIPKAYKLKKSNSKKIFLIWFKKWKKTN